MKKFFTLLTALFSLAVMSYAAPGFRLTPSALKALPAEHRMAAPQNTLTLSSNSSLNARPNSSSLKETPASGIITETPSGKSFLMEAESLSTFPLWGAVYQQPDVASAKDMVIGEDGYIYVKNLLTGMITDSWVKGLKWGDRVYFNFPQPVATLEGYGTASLYKMHLVTWTEGGETYSTYEPDETSQSAIFTYTDGVLKQEEENVMIGLCIEVTDEKNQSALAWIGYGEEYLYLEEFEGTPQEMPTDKETSSFVFKWDYFGTAQGRYVEGIIDTDKVYFNNFFGDENGVIIGDIQGDKVVFPSKQYLGVFDNHFCYFAGGHRVLDQTSPDYGNVVFDPEVTFNFDRKNLLLTMADTNQSLLLNAGNEQVYFTTAYDNAEYYEGYEPAMAFPGTPTQVNCEDHTELGHPYNYWMTFDLPIFNDSEQLLPTNRLFYRVFADGVPVKWDVLDGAEYIPYDTTVESTIYAYDAFHFVYISKPNVTTMGVQLYYLADDGEYVPSELVEVPSGSSGVDNIVIDSEIVRVDYYGIDGVCRPEPINGLNIRTTHFSDGHIKTDKFIK